MGAMTSVAAMSRAERRTRADAAATAADNHAEHAKAHVEAMWATSPLTAFGLARVSPTSSKWYAFKLDSSGNVTPLTPLRNGEMVGEGKPNATGRLKTALFLHVAGVES